MTAENRPRAADRRRRRNRFNEAAADDRGKPRRRRGGAAPAPAASMRPRPMTAENRLTAPDTRRHQPVLQ